MYISSGSSKGRKKQTNFELNLVPFIDVLSVCICFLLVTTVFMSLGSFHVSQAIGEQKEESASATDQSLMVSFGDQGELKLDTQKGEKTIHSRQLKGLRGQVDLDQLGKVLSQMTGNSTAIKTVLLLPHPQTKYDDLIQVMSQFRQSSFENIGVAPL